MIANTPVTELNLARKWRSQQFDEIVGQDLSVRMLKNSLFLGHYFPVYLFSGQRGCGKTTTARVFAAAVNCEQLSAFQKDPKASLPCRVCASCLAMQKAKHPDFIEIDAASHTGVDTIRSLIDSSSLLPLLGKKKVYLIDEAHMLSKAAFNALLKILEEPPVSVLFILATTDPHKILETVKSRCFQVHFAAIDGAVLQRHLVSICKAEKIAYDDDALSMVVKEAQGSARDAINLIEQVRFACGVITKKTVAETLGHLTDEALMQLFGLLVQRKPKQLLSFLASSPFYQSNALYVWHKLIDLLRTALWMKYNVQLPEEGIDAGQLAQLIQSTSIITLQQMMELFYENESIFLKTTNQHGFLEMLLLQLCSEPNKNQDDGRGGNSAMQSAFVSSPQENLAEDDDAEDDVIEEEEDEEEEEEDASRRWNRFVANIASLDDPLLTSVFQQGVFTAFSMDAQQVQVVFAKDFIFFKDLLAQTESSWLPFLEQAFGSGAILAPLFTGETKAVPVISRPAQPQPAARPTPKETPVKKTNTPTQHYSARRYAPRATGPQGKSLDVSDGAHWKRASLIVRYFPGTVIELTEQS